MSGPELQREVAERLGELRDYEAELAIMARKGRELMARMERTQAALGEFVARHKTETDAADWWKET